MVAKHSRKKNIRKKNQKVKSKKVIKHVGGDRKKWWGSRKRSAGRSTTWGFRSRAAKIIQGSQNDCLIQMDRFKNEFKNFREKTYLRFLMDFFNRGTQQLERKKGYEIYRDIVEYLIKREVNERDRKPINADLFSEDCFDYPVVDPIRREERPYVMLKETFIGKIIKKYQTNFAPEAGYDQKKERPIYRYPPQQGEVGYPPQAVYPPRQPGPQRQPAYQPNPYHTRQQAQTSNQRRNQRARVEFAV